MSNGEQQFIDRARASLEQRLEQTPAHVASRLSAARHHALDSRRRSKRPMWIPAMATAALVAVMVGGTWFGRTPVSDSPIDVTAVAALEQSTADFEMLAGGEDLALYADMDFYLWLEQQGVEAS